ncbi:unnamed protein product, partial [Symbiodinium pilosum]
EPPLPMLLGNLRNVEKPQKESIWCQEVNQRAHFFLPGVRTGSETLGIRGYEPKPVEAAELLSEKGFRKVAHVQWLMKRCYTFEGQAKKNLKHFYTLRWRPHWYRNYVILEDHPLLVQQAVRIWAQPLPATAIPVRDHGLRNPGADTGVPLPLSTNYPEHSRASRPWKGTKRFAKLHAL